jgi:hypothetical protein
MHITTLYSKIVKRSASAVAFAKLSSSLTMTCVVRGTEGETVLSMSKSEGLATINGARTFVVPGREKKWGGASIISSHGSETLRGVEMVKVATISAPEGISSSTMSETSSSSSGVSRRRHQRYESPRHNHTSEHSHSKQS